MWLLHREIQARHSVNLYGLTIPSTQVTHDRLHDFVLDIANYRDPLMSVLDQRHQSVRKRGFIRINEQNRQVKEAKNKPATR